MLKEIVESKKISHTEIARTAGLKQPYVWQLVNGQRKNPSISVIIGIAKALEMPASELFDLFARELLEAKTN